MYSVNLNIFEFDDFRAYLKRSVEILREQGSDFSFRKFSAAAGFTSPNFLILLMKGERNLSKESALKIATTFGLENHQKNFFVSLVQYNQAKDSTEKFNYAQELVKLKSKNQLYFINENQFQYYSHWINIAIRELVQSHPDLRAEQIADRLSPKQRVSDVEKSLTILQELGLINRVHGRWVVTDKNISTGEKFIAASVVEFHKQVIELGKQSLDRYPKAERDITASTVSLNPETFEKIRKRMQEFRLEILAIAETEAAAANSTSEVYQFNFQIFPLTKNTKDIL